MARGLFFVVALCNTACGSTTLNYIETRQPPGRLHQRSPERVEIFMTGKPDRPFVEIGLIESQQGGADGVKAVIAKMRRFAGERGCDALVIFAGNDATVTSGGKDFTVSETLRGYRGSCLVYTASPAAPPPPPLAATGCIPNSTLLCYGPGGCRGGQRCTEDGASYTLCDCGVAPGVQQPSAAVGGSNAR